jgi:alkylhydroperoxidase family enzyme
MEFRKVITDMKSRIECIPLDEAVRLGSEMGVREVQAGKNAFRMLAHHPDLVRHLYGLLTMLSTRNKLDSRLRELMIMRIAWTTGSEYAWFQHFRIATTQAGVSPEEILAVRDWRGSELFGPTERAVLAAVDDTCAHGKVSDAVWAECGRHLKEPAVLIEMVVAIANWIMFSQLLQSLRVPLEAGAAPWPPDGKGPTPAGIY